METVSYYLVRYSFKYQLIGLAVVNTSRYVTSLSVLFKVCKIIPYRFHQRFPTQIAITGVSNFIY